MAGVWKLWKNPELVSWERAFAVPIDEPSQIMLPIHERMTIFLEPRNYPEYSLPPSDRLLIDWS